MQPLLLPGVDCFQVVFTIPEELSSLALGNRRPIFNLLFHAAWQSLKKVVENEQQFEPAAAMVLHTWNQHLESHVHVHAVVPGGGPSIVKPGTRSATVMASASGTPSAPRIWKIATPPPHQRPDRWWLVDADELRREFRTNFLSGLRRLHQGGELKLEGTWSPLQNSECFEEFLAPLEAKSWVTYIEPPPAASSPEDVVKYLARYLTGGPISDRRLVRFDGSHVTFTARKGTTHGGSKETEEVTVSAVEFVRRWSLHVLPSGFTKSRRFGGWSSQHRQRYLKECRELLAAHDTRNFRDSEAGESDPIPDSTPAAEVDAMPQLRPCPVCGHELERLERIHRTSWRDIFMSHARPAWYRSREPCG